MMSPEQTLLLASTDPRFGDSARHAIESVLVGDLDWTSLVRLALSHGMTPALLAALDAVDQSLVPSEFLAVLREHCGRVRDRSLTLVAELHAILEALERESVVAIAFKGPLMAELLFGDVGQRAPGDLDVLVRPEDVTCICRVLEGRGYTDSRGRALTSAQQRMYRNYQCEYLFMRSSDGIVVEPHWAFAQRQRAIDPDYRAMFDHALCLPLGGRDVRCLAPGDLLLALCIHGGKHRWERLSWIRDIAALLARWPQLDLESAVGRAKSTGCARILLLGLAVARRSAGVRLPVAIDRLIDRDQTLLALQQEVMMRLFDPAKPTEGDDNARVLGFAFRMRERWSDRMRYVLRTLLVPRLEHIEIVALPGSLLWAYYPLRWSRDYVVLPVWRLVKPWLRAPPNRRAP
jgi:hypothetical protein